MNRNIDPKPVTFVSNGKKYVISMRHKNAAGEPVALISLSDYSHIAITLKRSACGSSYYTIRHFWPVEREPVKGGFVVTSEPIFWDSARSLWGVRRKVSQMLKTMKREGIHPRLF